MTQAELTQTPDFSEGVAAFLGKREAEHRRRRPADASDDGGQRRQPPAVAADHALRFRSHCRISTSPSTGRSSRFSSASSTGSSARPRPHADFDARVVGRYVRYSAHVGALRSPARRPVPEVPWLGRDVSVDLQSSRRSTSTGGRSRCRIVLAIPALVFGYVFGIVELGLRGSLVVRRARDRTGADGFQSLGVYCLRYQVQTFGYLLLVTDRYPSLANEFS